MKAKHVKTNFHSEPRRESWENAESELKRLANFLGGFYQESDRGAVLMAASILDEVLASMIQMFLTNTSESKKLVESLNAPLGTFNSRILAAYSLGLIEEQEYKEVEVIRKLRILFGQSWEGMDFETPSVK